MKLINLYHSGPVISFPPPQSDSFSFTDIGDEVTSAFLALAYSGIAFVIAGSTKDSLKRK